MTSVNGITTNSGALTRVYLGNASEKEKWRYNYSAKLGNPGKKASAF